MDILFGILLGIAGMIVLVMIIALFSRKNYDVRSEIVIDAPIAKVFAYIRFLKNQDHFNKWVMADPDMKREFKGTDGAVGFIYGWNGNKKAGEGEVEIKAIDEGKSVTTEIRFIRPFAAVAQVVFTVEPTGPNQTKVTWHNASAMKYPMNVMVPIVEKMLPKDMHISLSTLKNILENNP